MLRWDPPRGRVLALAAHPDDETLGCGGALLLHRRRGDAVRVVTVTDGGAGDPRGFYRGKDYEALRRGEARRAARVLGVSGPEFWGFPDGRLSAARGLSSRLRALLRSERPAVVYRPSSSDPHPDHAALARAFERASAGIPLFDLRYEVGYLQRPSVAADVSAVFAAKRKAIAQYRSQLRYFDYRREAERLGLLRSLFLPGCERAEAFAR